MPLQKIAIIGNAGCGKSMLAQKLHTILHLPVYHLDQYFWKPNWTPPNPAEYKIIHDKLCDKPAWIIDGMNLRVLEYRIQRADLIIFLDIPRYLCFWNIFRRLVTYYGKETPSSAQGCKEGINWKFIKFLKWVWDFKKNYPPKIRALLKAHASTKRIYVLSSYQQIDQFIEEICKES